MILNMTDLVAAKRVLQEWLNILRSIPILSKNECTDGNSFQDCISHNFSMPTDPTACLPNPESIHEHIKQICLIPLTILIIGINFCVLMVIVWNRRFHTPAYMLIATLGIADLCVGFVSIGTLVTKAEEKTMNQCLIRIGFTIAACIESLFVLMLIAIERYVAVMNGLRYMQIVRKERILFGIILVSVISLLFGFLPLMGWRVSEYQNYCSFMYVVPSNYIISLFSTGVLIPISVMCVIYFKLFKRAQIHIKRIESIENIIQPRSSTGQLRISPRTARSLRTLMLVFGCVMLTWLPFLVTSLTQIICGDKSCYLKDIVGTHLLILGFSNSFLNPVIYALGTKDFRERFVLTCFGRLLCINSHQNPMTNANPSLSRNNSKL